MKQVSVTKYDNEKKLIPTFPPYEIYQYSDAILKHLPKEALKTKKTHLYSKEAVYYNDEKIGRRNHNGGGLLTTGKNATQKATLKKNYV